MDALHAALIALVVAGCGDAVPSSCLDQAEWQVALDHPDPSESTLTLLSDSVVVALGNRTNEDEHVGSETIQGAHLLRLGLDGNVLALVPTPEGDGGDHPGSIARFPLH